MPFIKHLPGGPLARHVESMWYQPGDEAVAPRRMVVLPSGRIELAIALDGSSPSLWSSMETAESAPGRAPSASLHLLRATPYVVSGRSRTGVVGISFKAHALRAFSFFRDVPGDHADGVTHLSLADAGRGSFDPWVERLQEAGTPAAMFRTLEAFLWRHLQPPHAHAEQVAHAVELLSDGQTARSMVDVAAAVGMGLRLFQQRFHEDTGMSPKTFARVMRLRAATQLARRSASGRWTDVAAQCNYSDQAHLVRDFRLLTGMTPSSYLHLPGQHASALPWHDCPHARRAAEAGRHLMVAK